MSKFMDPKASYVFIAGGTGGHIFPAVALAQGLYEKGYSVTFITDHRGQKYLDPYKNLFQDILVLETPKNGSFFPRVWNWFCFLTTNFFIQRKKLQDFYKKHYGRIFMAFGGQFTVVPFLLAKEYARNNNHLPSFAFYLQQSDGVMGLANKMLLPMGDKIFTTFPLGLGPKEISMGLPIREEFYHSAEKESIANNNKEEKSIKAKKFHVLILGGSQGASFWTSLILDVFSLMTPEERSGFFLYHQCPEHQVLSLENRYKTLGIHGDIRPFFHNLPHIMSKSSIILSRAGASTLGEICTLSKAALLVPYIHAKNNHQEHNGQYLVNKGGAWMIRQKDITPQKVKDILLWGFNHPDLLTEMGKKNHDLMDQKAFQIFWDYVSSVFPLS